MFPFANPWKTKVLSGVLPSQSNHLLLLRMWDANQSAPNISPSRVGIRMFAGAAQGLKGLKLSFIAPLCRPYRIPQLELC